MYLKHVYCTDGQLDATPRKRVPYSSVMDGLYKRIDNLEKALSDHHITSTAEVEGSSIGAGPVTSFSPTSFGATSVLTLSRYDRLVMLDVFFQEHKNFPFPFIPEQAVRTSVLDNTASISLIHSIYAISCLTTKAGDQDTRKTKGEYYSSLSWEQLDVDEPSIENAQTLILLCIACLIMGHGKKCWMRLGAAIRMVLALELHDESSWSGKSNVEMDIRRRCFFICYMIDRFSVCGSKRPMLITDSSLSLCLPSQIGETMAYSFKALPSYQMETEGLTNLIPMIIDITRILGNANNYIQRGGARADTVSPWHSLSSLSKVEDELKSWYQRFSAIKFSAIEMKNRASTTTWFLTWHIYHLIHVRIYRAFLPILDDGEKLENQVWQAQIIMACLEHANTIIELADNMILNEITFQPFILYCLASAGTVLIHAIYYRNELGLPSRAKLVHILEILLQTNSHSVFASTQCGILRKLHISHAGLVREYHNRSVQRSNLYTQDFFDRYQNPRIEHCYLSLAEPDDWMHSSLDGHDDIFKFEPLPTLLESLRGIPYARLEGEFELQPEGWTFEFSDLDTKDDSLNLNSPDLESLWQVPNIHDGHHELGNLLDADSGSLAAVGEMDESFLKVLQDLANGTTDDHIMP